MPIGVIMDGGEFVGPKTADPVSVLAVLIAPAMGPVGGTLMPISRPSAIDPNVPFVLPASCCVSAGGDPLRSRKVRIEPIAAQPAAGRNNGRRLDPDVDLDRRGRNVSDAVLRFVTRDRAQARA